MKERWDLEGTTAENLAVVAVNDSENRVVCIFYDPVPLAPDDVVFPRARLIAAAPELLEALREARDLLACARITEDDPHGEEMAAYLTMLDAAIAKAEGRA
jgi:hypothetical protein